MRPTRLVRIAALLAATCATTAVAPASGQQGRAAQTITLSDTLRARILEQVKAPAGFDVTVFAGPPVGMYPACLEAAPTGELFMCLDPNLSLDREKGRGRILRLVDTNRDGTADRYTVFQDSIDSPRGLVWDGETLYVMHPPSLSALRDTNGDGVADQRETLVRGLGFDLDFRGADHTTNGITMGIDGWLYVAVGDYGFLDATGRDGTRAQLRGGGVVRVRPDGSDLEIYARGARNIYDVAVDPFLNVFARDNTNDGGGWDLRLEYIPQSSNLGYPALFANFREETLAPLADYGAGSGTAGLWVQDPNFPEGFGNTLYTGDWTLNKVFRQPLRARGAWFDVQNEEFLTIPHPSDMVIDGSSNLYIASLAGGSFTYVGDNVGYIVRVSPGGRSAAPFAGTAGLAEARLVELLVSPNAVHRLAAQRELLRRGSSSATVRRLEQLVLDARQPDYARVAAMFTLKQMAGAASHRTLVRAAQEPALRALALRALTDRRGELRGVSHDLFVRSLRDPDPRVQQHAIVGLQRLGARTAARDIFDLTASSDPVVSHVAVNALVELQAVSEALRQLDMGDRQRATVALRVLQRIHSPEVVNALVERLGQARDAESRAFLLGGLARLYNRDATWTGGWWTTRPDTRGPYYEPATWEESERIRPLLREALLGAGAQEFPALVQLLTRNRVLPTGADSLLIALGPAPERAELLGALVGRSAVNAELMPLLTRVAGRGGDTRDAVIGMLVAQTPLPAASVPTIRAAALDRSVPAALRSRALTALGTLPGDQGLTAAAAVYARLTPELADNAELAQAWRRFAGDRRNLAQIDHYIGLTRSADAGERALGYAVLVQIARVPRNPEQARTRASSAIDAAWADRTAAASLVRALELMNAESLYAERVQAYRAAESK